ncbi:MAG TPA: hypothetical protein VMU35_02965 [Methylomirabilota bacterium]|nr:hypothetical protein [Methylomirabilota bacterium]
MLFKTTISGVAALVIGIVLLTFAGQYITMTVQNVQRTDIEPHAEFLVGDVEQRSYSLPANVMVFGTVKVTQAPTNQSGDIRFIVFDDENYQKWNAGGQANFAYSMEKQGDFNYTFTSTGNVVYHFVFDNRASLYKKYVIFSLAYNDIVTSQVPDPRVQYVAYVLIGAGALLLVIGLMKKPSPRWSD